MRLFERPYLLLGVIIILAISVRVVFCVIGANAPPTHDAASYDTLAMRIVEDPHWYGPEYSSKRAPLYPLFVAGVYKLFGHSYRAVQIVQSLLCGFICFCLYLIGRTLYGALSGLIAAGIYALYPISIYYTGQLLTETFFTFLLVTSITLLVVRLKRTLLPYCLSGLFLGLAIVSRPVVLFLPLCMGAFLWLMYRKEAKDLTRRSVLFVLIAYAVLVPWTIRNYMVHHAFVPVTTEAGYQLYFSNNPLADGAGVYREGVYALFRQEYNKVVYPYVNEVDRQKALLRKGVDFIVHNPGRFAYLMFDKSIRFWNILPQTTRRDQIISLFSYGVLLPFFIAGCLRPQSKEAVLLLVVIGYVALFHCTISYGSVRFRMPIEPFIIIIAASVVSRMIPKRKEISV